MAEDGFGNEAIEGRARRGCTTRAIGDSSTEPRDAGRQGGRIAQEKGRQTINTPLKDDGEDRRGGWIQNTPTIDGVQASPSAGNESRNVRPRAARLDAEIGGEAGRGGRGAGGRHGTTRRRPQDAVIHAGRGTQAPRPRGHHGYPVAQSSQRKTATSSPRTAPPQSSAPVR